MNPEYMARMSASELDEYGAALGIEMRPAKTKDDKRRLIERRRGRVAVVRALGIDFEIPVKRARDRRLSGLVGKPDATDADMESAMRLLLGDEQMAELAEACTEPDGTVDVDAMAAAYVRIVTSDELKNF